MGVFDVVNFIRADVANFGLAPRYAAVRFPPWTNPWTNSALTYGDLVFGQLAKPRKESTLLIGINRVLLRPLPLLGARSLGPRF